MLNFYKNKINSLEYFQNLIMQNKYYKLSVFLLLFMSLSISNAQESILSSGGSANSEEGSVSYSIGQVFYTAVANENGSVSQGVQQPYEIFIVDGIENFNSISLEASAFPNPTSDILFISVKELEKHEDLVFFIYDIKGKLISNQKITENRTQVIIGDLDSGVYFLKITNKKKEFKTFKIIKTQ